VLPVRLFHIAERSDWDARTAAAYRPTSFESEGFIHCSQGGQLRAVAARLFEGTRDLMLLTIDARRITSEVVFEDLYETGEDYPHIYGDIDLDAIEAVRPFPADDTGGFDWWNPESDVIAKPAARWSAAVADLLDWFESAGFPGAPRARGIRNGLAFTSYVAGSTCTVPLPSWLDSSALLRLGRLIRNAHDASMGAQTNHPWMVGRLEVRPGEVVLHRDIGPGNVVWRHARPVGLIDWDFAEPGAPIVDLALTAVNLCGLVPPERAAAGGIDPDTVPSRIEALVEGYGKHSRRAVEAAASDVLAEELSRIEAWGRHGMSPWGELRDVGIADRISETLRWLNG